MSSREWRWVNAITREIDEVDWWWLIMNKIQENYPTTWDAHQLSKPLEKRCLLKDEITWGVSAQNFEAAQGQAAFNVTHNNSPQRQRWIGGARRDILQFVITEFSYAHTEVSVTDTWKEPPWRYMATKPIFEHMLSTNSQWMRDLGIAFIANPSVVQDGKNFGNFGLVNNFQAPINMFVDNNMWKHVLLWQIKIIEDLT
jgi:hypothetical protein